MKYKYKFSFVMPVYNTGKYVREAVESITAQSIGFKENCEIILVNDGSSDDSAKICRQLKKEHPDNIKYYGISHGGVAKARNYGIKKTQGKYISFLDSDDKISKDTLKEVHKFFEKNYNRVDFVSIKIEFFDQRTGNHFLNYKFNRNRVIDISDDYQDIQLSGGSSFVKSSVFDRYSFDETLTSTSDAKLLLYLVLDKKAYGVVSEPVYYYRKRGVSDSIIDSTKSNLDWYLLVPNRVHIEIIEYCMGEYGDIPKYIQSALAYDIQWRLKQPDVGPLKKKNLAEYRNTLKQALKYIEDDIILSTRTFFEYKVNMLRVKYDSDIYREIQIDDAGNLTVRGLNLYSLQRTKIFLNENSKFLTGYHTGFLPSNCEIIAISLLGWRRAHRTNKHDRHTYSLGEIIYTKPFVYFKLNNNALIRKFTKIIVRINDADKYRHFLLKTESYQDIQ